MVCRDDIVNEARTWIGVKWKHQGRTRDGIDCAGLIVLVGKSLGLTNYDYTEYRRHSQSVNFADYFLDGGGIKKNAKDVSAGDILIFRQVQYPCHSAIVSKKNGILHIIHSYVPRRVVFEESLSKLWLERRIYAFSYPGIE